MANADDQSGIARAALEAKEAPVLTGTSGTPLEVRLTWSEVVGAHEYVLERANGWDPVVERLRFAEVYRGPSREFHEVPVLSTSNATWTYRVRAGDLSEAEIWSEVMELYTGF